MARKSMYEEGPMTALNSRVPVSMYEDLRELNEQTRVPMSEYIREAVEDLLAKYRVRKDVNSGRAR